MCLGLAQSHCVSIVADSAEATGLKWATPAGGGGKVLQVINATSATQTSNSTSTYADTTLTATITPTSATSKVLVLVNQSGLSRGNQDDANAVMVRLLRGATEIVPDFAGRVGSNGGNNYLWAGAAANTNYLDSPSTTSATTYKTQFKNFRNGATVTVQSDSGTSTITLLEIGA